MNIFEERERERERVEVFEVDKEEERGVSHTILFTYFTIFIHTSYIYV